MKQDIENQQSFPFGYKADPSIVPFIRSFARTNPVFPTLLGLSYLLSMFMTGFCVDYLAQLGIWQAITAYFIGFLIIARQLRATEMLVHDGSHFSWDRKNRKLNDFLTNMIAAYPLLINLKTYRHDHVNHHKLFHSDLDSCFQRVIRTGIHEANKYDGLVRRKMLFKCLPRFIFDYIASTITEITTLKSILIGFSWHFIFILLPVYYFSESISVTLVSWGVYFWIPYLFLLPVFLFCNDAQDHKYSENTEFSATMNSVGWWNVLFFAPVNTGYHLLHHLFPATPLWQCKKFHKKLMAHDKFYATNSRYFLNPLGSVYPAQKSVTHTD
jgi:fatty acid desaturase